MSSTAHLPEGVRHASPADADELAELLAEAFFDDPLTRWITPDPGRRAQVLPGFFRVFLDLSFAHEGVLTDPDGAAVLLFLPPGAWEETEADAAGLEARFAAVLGDEAEALATITALQAEHHPTQLPHYYLSFGAVRPGARGRGLLQRLVAHVADRADATGVGVYAEASTPGGEKSCLRNGFAPVGDAITLPGDGPGLRPMWRDPR